MPLTGSGKQFAFPALFVVKYLLLITCYCAPLIFIFPRVLKALTRKFKLHEDVSLYSIARKCPPNFTGADMYALCADAWFHAAKRKVSPARIAGSYNYLTCILFDVRPVVVSR